MSGRLPDFVIIGAMKCATSTLHTQLAAQPGFCMSEPKEPNFFSDADQWARGMDWYRGLFAGAAPGDLCGESSTHYTKLPTLPDALPRIAEHLPDARFIYVMRHPIDRLVSHFVHEWSQRVIDGTSIDGAADRHPALIDYSRYAMQLRPWLDHFGSDRVLPVFFERMIAHPQTELERVCRFLSYDGTPQWQEGVRDNAGEERMRKSPLRDAIVYNPLVSIVRTRLIPPSFRNRVKTLWQMREKPVLGDAERARLEEIVDHDLLQLGSMLGVSLTCANFKSVVRDHELNWI